MQKGLPNDYDDLMNKSSLENVKLLLVKGHGRRNGTDISLKGKNVFFSYAIKNRKKPVTSTHRI